MEIKNQTTVQAKGGILQNIKKRREEKYNEP